MKIKDGVIGFAIGDAMGVPLEFYKRETLKDKNINEMIGNLSHNKPKGTWSDDTSLVLATMDSINESKRINYNDMMIKFRKWLTESKYTPNNETFGVGKITLQALGNYKRGSKPTKSGLNTYMSNGNGSLMRILPICYYSYYNNLNNDELYNLVKDVSSLTHRHEISMLGSYIYTLYVHEILSNNSKEEAYTFIQNYNYSNFSEESLLEYKRIIYDNINEVNIDDIKSTAYIVDTLESVFHTFLTTNSYDESIIKAIHLGNDTDTIAALTGALAGIYYGFDSINKVWINDLVNYSYIKDVTNNFENYLLDMF